MIYKLIQDISQEEKKSFRPIFSSIHQLSNSNILT